MYEKLKNDCTQSAEIKHCMESKNGTHHKDWLSFEIIHSIINEFRSHEDIDVIAIYFDNALFSYIND